MRTASQLITELKERGNFASQGDLLYDDDTKVLGLLNNALEHKVFPLIIATEPSYYRTQQEFTISDSLRVTIPVAAFNRQLYEVEILNSSGKAENVPIVLFAKAAETRGYSRAFLIEGNDVVFIGNGIAGHTARLTYHKRVLPLTLDANSITIDSDNTRNNGFIVGETVPAGFTANAAVLAQSVSDPFMVTELNIVAINDPPSGGTGKDIVFSATPNDKDTITLAAAVLRPQVTEQAEELIVLETLATMLLGDAKRMSILRELEITARRISQSLKKRVVKETREALAPSDLWGAGYYRPSEHESGGWW